MAKDGARTRFGKGSSQDQERQTMMMAPTEPRQHEGPSQKTALPRWKNRGKEESSVALACTWIVDHQIGIALNVLSILFCVHMFFPNARHHTSKFFQISYYNPKTGNFALGWDDIFFVFFWIIVFTGARCATMDYLLTPLASWAGISKKKTQVRFAEQTWIILYHGSFFSTGMYIMYNSDYWFNFRNLWKDWPIREMEGLGKWYYLVEFAFWVQQIVVVNIEERRKDHWQMFTHHIITCALVFGSYGYHQTRVGNLIMCLMDVVDLVFSTAKVLKYMGCQLACDIAFGVFMVSWFVARHIMYLSVCYSLYAHTPDEISFGCYYGSTTDLKGPIPVPNDWDHLIQPFLNPVGLVCWNQNIKWTFLGLLLSLQVVLLIWFGMIMRVAYKVLTGKGADDSRSDDEDDEENVEEEDQPLTRTNCVEKIPKDTDATSTYLEREVLSTDPAFDFNPAHLDNKTRPEASPVRRSARKKGDGHSSGVNMLAGSDRKELLGRIGCDKPGSAGLPLRARPTQPSGGGAGGAHRGN